MNHTKLHHQKITYPDVWQSTTRVLIVPEKPAVVLKSKRCPDYLWHETYFLTFVQSGQQFSEFWGFDRSKRKWLLPCGLVLSANSVSRIRRFLRRVISVLWHIFKKKYTHIEKYTHWVLRFFSLTHYRNKIGSLPASESKVMQPLMSSTCCIIQCHYLTRWLIRQLLAVLSSNTLK